MTYIGEIQHGVVILRDAPVFADGTTVRVDVLPTQASPALGSAEAVLRHVGGWAHIAADVDAALDDLRESKQAELRLQLAKPDEEL